MSYLSQKTKRWATIGFTAILLGLGSAPLLQAENMRSDSYIIQFGNFNVTSGEKSGGGYKVTDTVGQVAPGQFAAAGYTVSSGFQYIYAIPRFTFRIIGLDIDLGSLTPNTFSQASNRLEITTRSGGYSILAAADHELRLTPGVEVILHTECDVNCTINSAGIWNDPQRVGFGFNVAGIHRSSDFQDGRYFRPFADREKNQSTQTIASHNSLVKDDSLTVTYKTAVSDTQAAGEYQTAIDFIAVPLY